MSRWFSFYFLYCLYPYNSSKNQCVNKKKRRASEMARWVSGLDAKSQGLSLNQMVDGEHLRSLLTLFAYISPDITCWFEQVFSAPFLGFLGLWTLWSQESVRFTPQFFAAPGYRTAPKLFQIALPLSPFWCLEMSFSFLLQELKFLQANVCIWSLSSHICYICNCSVTTDFSVSQREAQHWQEGWFKFGETKYLVLFSPGFVFTLH